MRYSVIEHLDMMYSHESMTEKAERAVSATTSMGMGPKQCGVEEVSPISYYNLLAGLEERL